MLTGGSKGEGYNWRCKEGGSQARGRPKRHPWLLAYHFQECGHAEWHGAGLDSSQS